MEAVGGRCATDAAGPAGASPRPRRTARPVKNETDYEERG